MFGAVALARANGDLVTAGLLLGGELENVVSEEEKAQTDPTCGFIQ